MRGDPKVVHGARIPLWVAWIAGAILLVGIFFGPHIAFMFFSVVGPLDGNGPVEFYGRVVDPEGDALPGVTLSAKVNVYGIFRGHYQRNLAAESDDDGNFRIKLRKGSRIHLYNFSKQGFQIRGRPAEIKGMSVGVIENWNFTFKPTVRDRTQTSFEDPFVFVMAPTESP